MSIKLPDNNSMDNTYDSRIYLSRLADALAQLDKILVETSPLDNRGLQVETAVLKVQPYLVGSKLTEYVNYEKTPEAYIDGLTKLAFYPLLSDTLDDTGNTTAVTTGTAFSNSTRGLQSALAQPINWDGNTLAELNADANTDGFNISSTFEVSKI